MREFQWAVIGAGPAGIAAVGKLLDNGVAPKAVSWIDPEFRVGDLGKKWSRVSSNTKAHRFVEFLNGCKSFSYDDSGKHFDLERLDPQKTCALQYVVEPLQWITDGLRGRVASMESRVSSLRPQGKHWCLQSDRGVLLHSRNVVLAVGAEPKRLDYQNPCVSLEDALDVRRLSKALDRDDVVGVFGSSHSAMMSMHNLLELGTKLVINFYRTPLRYAVDYGDWILYDNTGLKGETAEWARREIDGRPANGLLRVRASRGNINRHLRKCSKVIYGIGFEPRRIPVEGADPAKYDLSTGIIAPGLFGCGIAFPERVTDRAGNTEYNVGLWKFMQYLDRVVPIWLGEARPACARARGRMARPMTPES